MTDNEKLEFNQSLLAEFCSEDLTLEFDKDIGFTIHTIGRIDEGSYLCDVPHTNVLSSFDKFHWSPIVIN
jgi:hypothetical protein